MYLGENISQQLPSVLPGTGTRPLRYFIEETLPSGLSFNADTLILSGISTTLLISRVYTYKVTDSAFPSRMDSIPFFMQVIARPTPGRPIFDNVRTQGTFLQIYFRAPDNAEAAAVNGYDVQFRVQGAANWTRALLGFSGGRVFLIIRNWAQGTTYEYRIRAKSSTTRLVGPWTTGSYMTDAARPEPVNNLKAIPGATTTPGQVVVSWTADTTGGPITLYRVEYRLGSGDWVSGTTTTATSATLVLNEGTNYSFRVRSEGPGGESAWETTTGTTSSSTYAPRFTDATKSYEMQTLSSGNSFTLDTADGKPTAITYRISASTPLPSFLRFNATTRRLWASRTLQAADIGTYTFLLQATNTVGSGYQAITVNVIADTTPAPLPPRNLRYRVSSGIYVLRFSASANAGAAGPINYNVVVRRSGQTLRYGNRPAGQEIFLDGTNTNNDYTAEVSAIGPYGSANASIELTRTPFVGTLPDSPNYRLTVRQGQRLVVAMPTVDGYPSVSYRLNPISSSADRQVPSWARLSSNFLILTPTTSDRPGEYEMWYNASNGTQGNSRRVVITLQRATNLTAPSFGAAPAPYDIRPGETKSWTLPDAGGNPRATYKLTGLPSWASYNASRRLLTATAPSSAPLISHPLVHEATNSQGTARQTLILRVATGPAPTVVINGPTVVDGGESVTLTTTITGNVSSYAWSRDLGTIRPSATGEQAIWQAPASTNADQEATVTVVVTAVDGQTARYELEIRIRGTDTKLDTPSPSEISDTRTTITIGWSAIDNATGYRVRWRFLPTDAWQSTTTTGTRATITGLVAGRTYMVEVTAVSSRTGFSDSDPAVISADTEGDAVKLATPSPSFHDSTTLSITIRWSHVSNATGYRVLYRLDRSGTSFVTDNVVVSSPASGIRQAVISGLDPGESYVIEVIAVSSSTSYNDSDPGRLTASTESATILSAPSLTAGVADEASVPLSWTASSPSAGVLDYAIEWWPADDTSDVSRANITTLSFTITGLDASKSYRCRVRAKGRSGYQDSAWSNTVSFMTTAPTTTQLATPSPSEASSTQTSVTVEWAHVANASSYRVRWRFLPTDRWSTAGVVQSSPSSGLRRAVISGLTAGTAYTIEVTAISTSAQYTDSQPGQATATTDGLLSVPSLTAGTPDDDSVLVSWTQSSPVANVSGYELEWWPALDTGDVSSATVTATSRTISGLTANTAYRCRVRAKGRSGYQDSAWSNTVSFMTAMTQVDPPTNVRAVSGSIPIVTIHWTLPLSLTGISSYRLEYKLSNQIWSQSTVINTTSSSISNIGIHGLQTNTNYDVRIRSTASAGYLNSDFATASFRTRA